MGNSACSTPATVAALSNDELGATKADDEYCLSLLQQHLPSTEIAKLPDVEKYSAGGAVSAAPVKPEAKELVLLALRSDPQKLSDTQKEVVKALAQQVKNLQAAEKSAEASFERAEVQALYRIYDALLREEERGKRQLFEETKDRTKEKKPKSDLPVVGRVGLSFGLRVVLALKDVGHEKTEIVREVLSISASVLSEVEALSMSGYGDLVESWLDALTSLLNSVVNGEIQGLEKSDEGKAIAALMGLALASGNLIACLAVAQKLLNSTPDDQWPELLSNLVPMLRGLHSLAPSSGPSTTWNWNAGRLGPEIALSNESKTITRTTSNAWGNNLSEQTVTSGIHYIEFHIDRNSSSCLLVGVAKVDFSDWGSKCSVAGVVCYQADGDTYVNGSSAGNIGSYTGGDRVGMLIDMEDRKLTYYKNGARMNHDPFTDLPEEVALIICFGGSDQFVSITDEPEIPGDIDVKLTGVKKGQSSEDSEVPAFRKTADEVLNDPMFQLFTKEESVSNESPLLAATFLLASLDLQADRRFSVFELDKLKSNYSSKVKFGRVQNLEVNVQQSTFQSLLDMLKGLMSVFTEKQWREVDFRLVTWSALSCLRILRNHIFAAKVLELTAEQMGLTDEMKETVRSVLAFFSKLTLETLELESTQENAFAVDTLVATAASTTIHSFELNYPTLNSQLAYVIEKLADADSQEQGEKRLLTEVMKKVSLPLSLFIAFDTTTEESRLRIQRYIEVILPLTAAQSLAFIKGEEPLDEGLHAAFFMAQNVLFARAAQANTSEEVSSIFHFFVLKFLDCLEELAAAALEVTHGTLTDDHESRLMKTLLGKHMLTFFKALSIMQFDIEFNIQLMAKLQKLATVLAGMQGGKPQRVKGYALVREVYESAHPYPDNADLTHKVEIPHAIDYVLTFDPQCNSEKNYDKLTLWSEEEKVNEVAVFDGDTWPRTKSVKQPLLFFTFHSDGSGSRWGWKIDIDARVDVDLVKDCWIDELRNYASSLLVSMCKGLVTSADSEASSSVANLLTNPLFKAGVRDSYLFRQLPDIPVVSDSLKFLIDSTETQVRLETARSSANYSDIPILEEFISGSERTVAALNRLKTEAKVNEQVLAMGGEELDQAERALFAVFLAYFELPETFAAMTESPREVSDMFLHLVKVACSIRQWARDRCNSSGASFADVGKTVVEKCGLLLGVDYRRAMRNIGVEKVLSSLAATVRKHTGEEEAEVPVLQAGSKWGTLHKAMGTVKLLQNLHRLKYPRKSEESADSTPPDRQQFQAVYDCILKVLDSDLSVADIVTEVASRRTRAVSRAVGLNIMQKIGAGGFQGKMVGILASAFVEAFTDANGKKHYTEGIEGVDALIVENVQTYFFMLYQHFFNYFKPEVVDTLDCTSNSSFTNLMNLLDALNFTFIPTDTPHLLSLQVRESLELMLSWCMGEHITGRVPKRFDSSKAIADLKVFQETDYKETAGARTMQLGVERKGSDEDDEEDEYEEDEEEDGRQKDSYRGKKLLEITTGNLVPSLPLIAEITVASPSSSIEGFTLLPGNVSDIREEMAFFVRREVPREGGQYLTNIRVVGSKPIEFEFEYQPYAHFIVETISESEQENRAKRRTIYRQAAWLLFKLLTYTNAAKGGESATDEKSLLNLQALFAQLIFSRIQFPSLPTTQSGNLQLRKLLSGKLWWTRNPAVQLSRNPVISWVERVREDAEEFLLREQSAGREPGPFDVSLVDVINDYLMHCDPLLKGVRKLEEVPQARKEYLNAKGEVDFFCFLRFAVSDSLGHIGPFWKSHIAGPAYQDLPKDYYEAKRLYGDVTIPSLINVLISMAHRSSADSIVNYLNLLKSSDTPGVVPRSKVPKETPAEFLNADNDLDLFKTLRAVRSNQNKFPLYYKEINQVLDFYPDLPNSCHSFYQPNSYSAQMDLQASLLMLLYQCSHSSSMLKTLAKPNYLLELLKHMVMGTAQTSTVAFRLVREVLCTQHSPESFSDLWTSFPKGRLRAELGSEVTSDFLLVLFTFIGMRALTHARSLKYCYMDTQRIERFGFEALTLLQTLSRNPRWAQHITTAGFTLLDKSRQGIISRSEVLVGFLAFLKYFAVAQDSAVLEWNKVKLVGLSSNEGLLIRYDTVAQIYSPDMNQLTKEKKECVAHTLLDSSFSLIDTLPTALVQDLYSSLVLFFESLVTKSTTSRDTSAEGMLAWSSVRRTAQCFIIDIISFILDSKHELSSEFAGKVVSLLVQEMGNDERAGFELLTQGLKSELFARHRLLMSIWLKVTAVESRAKNTVSEADEMRTLAGYNSDQRCLVKVLKDLGLHFGTIKEAVDLGLTSAEDVLNLLNDRSRTKRREMEALSQSDALTLYQLTKSESQRPEFIGRSEGASYKESAAGKLVLVLKESPDIPYFYLKTLDESIFEKLEVPPEELTVLAVIGFLTRPEPCSFGFVLGNIVLRVSLTPQQVAESTVRKNYSFRLFLNHKREVKAYNDLGSALLLESSDGINFENAPNVKYGILLESKGKVALKGFAIYLGRYLGSKNFWEEEDLENDVQKGRLIDYAVKEQPVTEVALKSIIGTSQRYATDTAANSRDLKQAVTTVLSENPEISNLYDEFGSFIQDIVTVGSISEVPPEYTPVELLGDTEQQLDSGLRKGPVIAVKRATGKMTEFLKAIEWSNDALVPVKGSEKDQAIVSVLIVRTQNPWQLVLPPKHELVKVGTKAVNITNESGVYHFVVYCTAPTIRRLPTSDLGELAKDVPEGGQVDNFESEGNTENLTRDMLAKEVEKLSKLSRVQMQYRLAQMERSYRSKASFQLIVKLMKRWTHGVINTQQFATLLEHSSTNFQDLAPAVLSLLQSDETREIATQALLIDVLTQLCKSVTAGAVAETQLLQLTYESEHPYPNNADIKETINVPGAKKYSFRFVPECKSENNYDYLRFSYDSEFTAEIQKQTGTAWPDFEAGGPTVYFHFHSDGSNNDWGYKFTVEAAVAATSENMISTKRAIWILESIFILEPRLANFVPNFVRKEVVNALVVFIHSSVDAETVMRALEVLKRMLQVSSERDRPNSLAVLDLLKRETVALYAKESSKKTKTYMLRALISVFTDIKETFDFEMGVDWFDAFYEKYLFLRGFVNKDENFQISLLRQFLESRGKSLNIIKESPHPYPGRLITEELRIEGASSIEVQLSKESESRPTDGILFTEDQEGRKVISTGPSGPSVFAWNSAVKGPDIAISNEGLSVTRTDSSGWGCAIGSDVFREGEATITFKIVNDGGSDYLYLGLIEECAPYPLSDCINKDHAKRVWVYKRTGELHTKNNTASVPSCTTNDTITIALDCAAQTVTFFKNSVKVAQYYGLNVPTNVIACFGGSNQHLTVESFEGGKLNPMKLSEFAITIPSERCFFHFPVHAGYFDLINARWRKEDNPLLSFAHTGKVFTRLPGDITPTTVYSARSIKAERNLLEFKVVSMVEGTACSFGLGQVDSSEFPILYSNNGMLIKTGETSKIDGFRSGDCVAIFYNQLKGELCVYKNGGQISPFIRYTLESGKEFRFCVTLNGEAKIEIPEFSQAADTVDFLCRSGNLPRGPFNKYGYRMTATPAFIGKRKKFIFKILGDSTKEWEAYLAKQKSLFSDEVCEQVVRYLEEKFGGEEKDAFERSDQEVSPTPQELEQYSHLKTLSVEDIRSVFNVIKDINAKISAVLPIVTLKFPENPLRQSEFHKILLRLRSIISSRKKNSILTEVLSLTVSSDRPTVEINYSQAEKLREKGVVDTFGTISVFGQVYRQLSTVAHKLLRNADWTFRVQTPGGSAEDTADAFTQAFTALCRELQLQSLPLFVLSPNGQLNMGENRDALLPSPAADAHIYAEMYQFVGKVLGMAIRTKTHLPMTLSPVFWKRLLFEPLRTEDIKSFDANTYQTLGILRRLNEAGVTPEHLAMAFEKQTFTTVDSSQRPVELLPGGKAIPLTLSNAQKYADLLERQRLTEASFAYSNIRKGLSALAPLYKLYLFTPVELENVICGPPDFSVDQLSANTVYEGYSESSKQVVQLWEVLKQFTSKERTLFLRFVSSRSRLPATEPLQKFRVVKLEVEKPNDALPQARAKSFTLELPAYPTRKKLKDKLLHAITYCQPSDLEVMAAEGETTTEVVSS